MHVHVHHVGRHLDEEEGLEAPVASARRAVGLEDRLRERPVAHGPAVDEEAEVRPRGPRPVGPRHEAAHRRPLRAALHGDDVLDHPRPEQLEEPRGEPVHRGRLQERPPARLQREPRPGPGQGQQGERLRDVRGLRRSGAQELAPGGDGAEQVPDLDRGPARVPRVTDVQPPAVGDRHLRPGRARLLPGPEDEVGDGRDRRQRLPAEAVSGDRLQVLERVELGRGVPLERHLRVGSTHAVPVVPHPDEADPAVLDLHVDGARPRVERVLHELFHHGGGSLHDLAGRDLVDEVVREPLDRAHSHFFFRAQRTIPLGTATMRASAQR